MSYSFKRSYRGGLQAIVFDWAGTVLDFGCMAPTVVFQQVFANVGVPISMEEAREPMGAHKKVHIREITRMPAVRRRWLEKHRREVTEADVEQMYAEFVPLQVACLSQYSTLIPGALDIVAELRRRKYKIGSTTGYTAEMMQVVMREAENQGFIPDSMVCASEVPEGRPSPFMLWQNLQQLGVYPVSACVKIDDTVVGVEEGLNAGCWTIGLAVSGNDVGLPLDVWKTLPEGERRILAARAYDKHRRSGAHYVVDSVNEILPCVDDIERRLKNGDAP